MGLVDSRDIRGGYQVLCQVENGQEPRSERYHYRGRSRTLLPTTPLNIYKKLVPKQVEEDLQLTMMQLMAAALCISIAEQVRNGLGRDANTLSPSQLDSFYLVRDAINSHLTPILLMKPTVNIPLLSILYPYYISSQAREPAVLLLPLAR